ncbi:MAG: hypothetical protein K2P81_03380 [Bacteriovoracaceae bacterium]|nr:hypothetical protein [Bacteriovoracaceae bacterium]
MKKYNHVGPLFVLLAIAIGSIANNSHFFDFKSSQNRTLAGAQKRIVIGIDGLSDETFEHAQKNLNLFKKLKFKARHVAPFPSISDYSWNIITRGRELFGERGRIRSYEATYFSRDKNALVSDPREYFRRLAKTQFYFNGAFDHYLNPFVESLLYLPTKELPGMELRQLKEAILLDQKDLVTAMVASNDALAHTRPDSMEFLYKLDGFINELDLHYKNEGIDAEIIVISDHGQAARFHPGEEVLPLIPVDIYGFFKSLGYKSSTKLTNDKDVVIPVMALGNYSGIFFKNKKYIESVITKMQSNEWFEHAVYIVEDKVDYKRLKVFDHAGYADLEITRQEDSFTYRYQTQGSNPLHIPEDLIGSEINDSQARKGLRNSQYPDSLYRIAFSAFEIEADFPDLLFTVKNDFYIKGSLDGLTSMYQTHGSLDQRSTFGILASTKEFSKQNQDVRTNEILAAINLKPNDLFRMEKLGLDSSPSQTLKSIQASNGSGIETKSTDFNNKRIFEMMNRVSNYSQYVFDIQSMESIKELLGPLAKPEPGQPSSSFMDELKGKMEINDIAFLADAFIRTKDIEEFKKSAEFIRFTEKFKSQKASEGNPSNQGKKIVMKMYSSTFLIEKALNIPEFATIPDNRNLEFYQSWKQLDVAQDQKNKMVKDLFSEIFNERIIADDIAPTGLAYLYNPSLKAAQDVTFVYVPGIYNSIFENEIFQMGLDHLRNDMGLRVIEAPVLSACSSNYNADILLNFLKDDIARREERGLKAKYFIIGYSKGGVDSLHALAKNTKMAQDHILGLLAMASPIKGSSILNKTDIPFEILSLVSSEEIPEICKSTEKASNSITPEGAMTFLKNNAKKLVGLTRYYSLSFSSSIKESHIFMKATKTIGQFGEANDGVVTVSASKFPEGFGALDFGVVEGDHLSGIVASNFPQEAFLESIVTAVLEVEGLNVAKNSKFNELAFYSSSLLSADDHREKVQSMLGSDLEVLIKNKEVDKIKKIIADRLRGTPYDIKDFDIKSTDKGLQLVYSKPVFENMNLISFFKFNEKITFTNVNEMIDVILSKLQKSEHDVLASGAKVVVITPVSTRTKFVIPQNELPYNENFRINLRELGSYVGGKKVQPMERSAYKDGINIVYDHPSSLDFRREYQMSFESTAPFDADDNGTSGWTPFIDKDQKLWAKLASKNSSIRLSTYSMRFLAKDFPHLDLDFQVNKSVPGANVLFGGSGKDDSAFQVWLTFRVINDKTDRLYMSAKEDVYTLGYYFGDEIPSKSIELNRIYENYYSNKNFIIATLPPSFQKVIGVGESMKGKQILSKNNLLEDIATAYPKLDVNKVEILGITIQHDSNDTKSSSEALFRSMKFY